MTRPSEFRRLKPFLTIRIRVLLGFLTRATHQGDDVLAAAHAQIGNGKVVLGQPDQTEADIKERCASVPATGMSTSGACSPDWRNFSW
jgi:hypothetical protein